MASLPSSSSYVLAAASYHLFFFSFIIIFFIFLLFMISLQTRIHIFGDHHSNAAYEREEADRKFPILLSPSPAPAPVPTPALSPLLHHLHPPHHHPVHRPPIPIPNREVRKNGDGSRAKKMVVASLVSSGFIFILTVLIIIIFVCHYKFNKGRRSDLSSSSSSTTTITKYNTELGTADIKSNVPNWNIISSSSSFQNTTTRKVSNHDDESSLQQEEEQPPPHPFPLQTNSPKEDQESTSKEQLHPSSQGPILRSDSNTAAEIISIHDDNMDSDKYESDEAAEQKLEEDNESFHSLCDSPRSSNIRLSNASANSTTFNLNEPKSHPPPPPPPPPPLAPPSKALSSSKSPVSSNSEIKTHSPPPPCPPLNGKVDQSRLPKLKPLHWDKLRAAPHRSTVWDKLRCSSFELDEEMIESLFGYDLKHPTKGDEPKGSSPNTNNYHVLEAKRLQNITILSKSVNATSHQVCHSLEKGEGLCLQQLEVLAKMRLTKVEEDKLSGYIGDIDELGSAEKFVKTMLNVPFAFQRIESMLYRETFDDEILHLRKSLSMLQEACQELRSSRLFLKLLEAVLKTGNRMNDGTIRGGAKAFKLDALLKLADVKGTDGKTTLLHFVVQEIIRSEGMRASESIMGKICQKSQLTKNAEEKEEDYRRMGLDLVSSLSVELHNVKKTATIDLDVLSSSMCNMFDGMCRLKNVVDEIERLGSVEFVQLMRAFLCRADKNIKQLREEENEILWRVREITEYFHGVVNKDEGNPLGIFVIVRDFLGMLDHVCRELRSSKIPNSPNPLSLSLSLSPFR